MRRQPNVFIVGAAKTATTTLYHMLDVHPDCYVAPIKEPHFFSKDIRCGGFLPSYKKRVCWDIKRYIAKAVLEKKHIAFIESEQDYLQLFRNIQAEQVIAEFSTGYLYSEVAAHEIYSFNPDAKIVIILREPVARAFSHWMMDLRGGNASHNSFAEAVMADQEQSTREWGRKHLYLELGMYYEQVKRYMDVFPEKQILILLFEDLQKQPEEFFTTLYNFLEIVPPQHQVTEKRNQAAVPRFPKLVESLQSSYGVKWMKRLMPSIFLHALKNLFFETEAVPQLKDADLLRFRGHFKEDIEQLERLILRDLTIWKHAT